MGELLPIENPELYNERPPIRPEEIERIRTHLATFELRYTTVQDTLRQRAQELIENGENWDEEVDFLGIQAFKEEMDNFESEIFGFQDLPYDLARQFTLIQSRYYRQLNSLQMELFGTMSPQEALERLNASYTWGERDEGQIRRNFEEARMNSIDLNILEQEVHNRYQDFTIRGEAIRERLDSMIQESGTNFEDIDNSLDTLTEEMIDFKEEISRIRYYLPELSREDERNIWDGYENPYEAGTSEFESYRKHQRLRQLTEEGQALYDTIHDMAFEISALERQNTFLAQLTLFRNMNPTENPEDFFTMYLELLGNNRDVNGAMGGVRNTQLNENSWRVRQTYVEKLATGNTFPVYREYLLEHHNTILQPSENGLLYHTEISQTQEVSPRDMPSIQQIYGDYVSSENLEQAVQLHFMEEDTLEGRYAGMIRLNLDNDTYAYLRPSLRGFHMQALAGHIFVRKNERLPIVTNEMSHVVFQRLIGDESMESFLRGRHLRIFEAHGIPAQTLHQVNELLSDASSINAIRGDELNDPENLSQIRHEIERVNSFAFAAQNGRFPEEGYRATALFMLGVHPERETLDTQGVTSLGSLAQRVEHTQENNTLSQDEISSIQEAYRDVGYQALLLVSQLVRDIRQVDLILNIGGDVTIQGLNQVDAIKVQTLLQSLGYYSGNIDGIIGERSIDAILAYSIARIQD